MDTLELVADGPVVSRIGLGLAALGRPGYVNLGHGEDLDDRSVAGMRRRTGHMLDHAVGHGVRYVDAARSYGRAEEFLAAWLGERGSRDQVTIGSKWGYTYTADWQVDVETHEVKDHSLATFQRQWDETRAHLDGHVDLYQVHSATLDSGILDDPSVLDALTVLADQGVLVGLSLSGPAQAETLARALDLAEAGQAPFTVVQATWNVLEPSVGPALQRAADAGWGVICKEVVANGRLTDRGEPPGEVRACATAHGVTVDAVSIAAALAQPFTTVALSGASTIAQLDSNLAALQVELEADDVARLAGAAEDPASYWAHRDDLDWT